MFAKTIIDSDSFLDMPASAQALYFHLSMRADDDGFINNPKKIQRMVNSSDDDLRLLVAKRFIIPFDSGIVVIKHWKIHNYIQNDRYRPTIYQEEKAMLDVKENKEYSIVNGSCTPCIHNVSNMYSQDSIGKCSVVQDSTVEDTEPPAAAPAPAESPAEEPQRHRHGANGWVLLTDEQYKKLLHDLGPAELERCITYVDESAQITKNKNGWKDWNLLIRKCHREQWGAKHPKQKASEQPVQRKKTFSEILAEKKAGGAL